MKDEGHDVIDGDQLREALHFLLHVDVRQAIVTEDTELAAQAQVHARGLEEALVPGVDAQPAGLYFFADALVAKD